MKIEKKKAKMRNNLEDQEIKNFNMQIIRDSLK